MKKNALGRVQIMKLFTKLALVSAVAMSSNAMAMQAMDDAALSATTGQDGISIGIDASKVEIAKLHVFDGAVVKVQQSMKTQIKVFQPIQMVVMQILQKNV